MDVGVYAWRSGRVGFSCAPLKTAPACELRGQSGAKLADLSSVGRGGKRARLAPRSRNRPPLPRPPSAYGYAGVDHERPPGTRAQPPAPQDEPVFAQLKPVLGAANPACDAALFPGDELKHRTTRRRSPRRRSRRRRPPRAQWLPAEELVQVGRAAPPPPPLRGP